MADFQKKYYKYKSKYLKLKNTINKQSGGALFTRGEGKKECEPCTYHKVGTSCGKGLKCIKVDNPPVGEDGKKYSCYCGVKKTDPSQLTEKCTGPTSEEIQAEKIRKYQLKLEEDKRRRAKEDARRKSEARKARELAEKERLRKEEEERKRKLQRELALVKEEKRVTGKLEELKKETEVRGLRTTLKKTDFKKMKKTNKDCKTYANAEGEKINPDSETKEPLPVGSDNPFTRWACPSLDKKSVGPKPFKSKRGQACCT